MPTREEDLDLLLSLQEDRVLETPPASPSSHRPHLPGYLSDDGSPKRSRAADMSVFRDTVKDYLDAEPITTKPVPSKSSKPKASGEVAVEKFSGLRIQNQLVSGVELTNRFSDIRFVRLPAIKNSLSGDKLSGCWATVGVVIEKGSPKSSSNGKGFCVWKIGCLDDLNISVFLFGDAYTKNCSEPVGSVFALFNSAVRKDAGGNGFSMSIYSAGQILKVGSSADYGVCKGKRKDGMACTMVINKRQGAYCKYHSFNASQKYSTMRSELNGGNLQMASRLQSKGIYLVNPLADRSNSKNHVHRVKVMSVDGLKKALSNADKVTTNSQSQGIRFLTQVTASIEPKIPNKGSAKPSQTNGISVKPNQTKGASVKRPILAVKKSSKMVMKHEHPGVKRNKTHHASENMIELEIASSDEEG